MGDESIQSKAKSRVSIVSGAQRAQMKSMANFNKSMSRMRMRRMSYGFYGVPGIKVTERMSQVALEFKRPPLIYLPTYQLEPTFRFSIRIVQKIIEDILDTHFDGHKYNVQDSPRLALTVSGEVMRHCKGEYFNRYRIISVATVAQKRAQCYNNAICFLWDHERDNYVDVFRETISAFIQVTVFGVYLD